MPKSLAKETRAGRLGVAVLSSAVLRGDPRAAGRVLSLIDSRNPLAKRILKRLYPRTGHARVVGITGSAGSGKSTLIGRMTEELRQRKKPVGILTVDPTSPFTGGALLGDRVRMRDHFLDDGVFIRSLATRGNVGGISSSIMEAVQLLDAMGKEYILVETIGIGQDQVEIAGVAQAVLVVITTESGDDIQGIKAGVFEISDLLVINKADLPGAQELWAKLGSVPSFENVPIFKTSALRNEGIANLIDGIDEHLSKLAAGSNHNQRALEISRNQLLALIRDALLSKVSRRISKDRIESWARQVAERRSDPYSAAEAILARIGL